MLGVRFTKQDLRTIHASLTRLLPPAPSLPRTAEEVVEIGRVRDVVALAIRELAPTLQRGALVLTWRLPREQAPTLNEYAYMKTWQRKRLRKELDDQLRALIESSAGAVLLAPRPRWVRVTRFSTSKVDDLSVDVLGGKMPVDSLVRLGVLADDTQALMHREPRWEKTKRGNTHLLVEVFEMSHEGEHADEPADAPVRQMVRSEGPLTRELKGAP